MNESTVKEAKSRIPMIQTGQALQSLRDSGHNLPTAIGEVVDNSIEAKANNIRIRLDEALNSRGKKHVHQIAVIDDGVGMNAETLHHYLVLGFSTRYMRTDTIGKYGVGAKLAALNFGRRIDVWSRERVSDPWLHVHFDLDKAIEDETRGEAVGLDAPVEGSPPEELKNFLPEGPGTMVLWSRVDRLEEGRLAPDFNGLRLDLEKELSRIFRYFIDGGIVIEINGRRLIAHDPLLLMEDSWADFVLSKPRKQVLESEKLGRHGSKHFPAIVIADDSIKVGDSSARLRVTLYPKEVTRMRGMGGDALAKELRVPENEGCISFVRLNREVSYTNVPRILPSGVRDQDRFIGIEVAFKPDLDQFFGIRNVKRGVEPHGELRDAIRERLKRSIAQARQMIDESWGAVAREQHEEEGEHAAVTQAVKDVDVTMPKGRAAAPESPAEAQRALTDLARDLGYEKEEDQKQYIEKIKDLPFVVESVNFPGNMFISTQHLGDKVIIRLNTRHQFYRDMWEPIKAISERDPGTVSGDEAVRTARRTIEALTLLLIAYGKAESMHPNPAEQYEDLKMFWGQFLATLLGKVKNVL